MKQDIDIACGRIFKGPNAYPPLDGEPLRVHPRLMADFEIIAIAYLEQRDHEVAEASERAKPIDLKWCQSAGLPLKPFRAAESVIICGFRFLLVANKHLWVFLAKNENDPVVICATRGQVQDLLAGLQIKL